MSTLSVGGRDRATSPGTKAPLPRCGNSRSPSPNPLLGRSPRAQSRMAAPLSFLAATELRNRWIAIESLRDFSACDRFCYRFIRFQPPQHRRGPPARTSPTISPRRPEIGLCRSCAPISHYEPWKPWHPPPKTGLPRPCLVWCMHGYPKAETSTRDGRIPRFQKS